MFFFWVENCSLVYQNVLYTKKKKCYFKNYSLKGSSGNQNVFGIRDFFPN